MQNKALLSHSWFIILLVIPFLKPESISSMTELNIIVGMWQVASIFAIILLYIKCQDHISKFLIIVGSYQLCLLLSTVIYTNKLGLGLRRMLTAFFLCALIEIACETDAKCFIQSIYKVLWVWVFLNFISVILFSSHSNEIIMYFLGIRVTFTYVMITAITAGFLCIEYKKNNYIIPQFILVGMVLFSLVKVWVATGLLSIVILLFMCVMVSSGSKLKKLINFRWIITAGIALNIAIVIFRIQNLFQFIIVDILQKDLTFTGRTALWNHALKLISKRFLIGYGVATMKIEVPEMGENFSIYYGHSQLIQILIEGGIIGSLLFLGMLYICGKKIMKYQNSNMALILTSGLFVNIIIMITEVPAYYSYYFILLALGYNMKNLVHHEQLST